MTQFRIENTTSGHVFGVYEDETPEAAIQAMLDDAGHDGPADDDIRATPAETPFVRYHVPEDTMGDATEEQHRRFCDLLTERIREVYPDATVEVVCDRGIDVAYGFEPLRDYDVICRVYDLSDKLFNSGDWVEE